MELETLFTASKWEILRHLAETPRSPIQLAERSSTSLANISQQLRLLEMAGLVKSERIPNRDKGQPRILYSLASDQSYLISAASEFVEKKLLRLSTYNKAVLRIWFYDDPDTRYVLEKAFWHIEPLLSRMQFLGVHSVADDAVRFCAVSAELEEHDLPALTLTNLSGRSVKVSFELRRRGCGDRAHLLYAAERAAK